MKEKIFTARKRPKTTRTSVRVAEVVSRLLITVGGIGTIVAVMLIFVFLAAVVVPLFRGARVTGGEQVSSAAVGQAIGDVVELRVDEYGQLAWLLLADSTFRVVELDAGQVVESRRLFEKAPTAISVNVPSDDVAFGFADGSVVLARLGFATEFVEEEELTDEMRALEVGGRVSSTDGSVERVSNDQWRLVRPHVELEPRLAVYDSSAIAHLDLLRSLSLTTLVTMSADGELSVHEVRSFENWLTEELEYELDERSVPFEPNGLGLPDRLLLSGSGATLFLAWEDGGLQRYDLRDPDRPRLAETVDLVPEDGRELTDLQFLLGRATLLAGDSLGTTSAWFEAIDPVSGEIQLMLAHELQGPPSPVQGIASSGRTRIAVINYGDGRVRLFHVSTNEQLLELPAEGGSGGQVLAIAPREDAILRAGEGRMSLYRIDPKYPQANLSALFTKVWYEGYPEPEHVWQSSSATDDTEPKMGLVPLIFGTLKATLYSMLFGVPIALMAAIYSSEYLAPRVRATLKSLVEMMASLPSVVLGFLAGMVIAPIVQGHIASVLVSFLTLPFVLLLAANLYQLIPHRIALRLEGWPRFFLICLSLVPALLLALALGPLVESLLFGGDLEVWLDGQEPGGTWGGWLLFLLPLSALLVVPVMGRRVSPWIRRRSLEWSRLQCAVTDLGKYAAGSGATLVIALLLATALDGAGLDPRGGTWGVGTYVQRNALVVGFVMGFAIIPVIFTLAEDALTSVPPHLREASLGAGATRWQTATRVIIPTAMSGLYSACMIGLGRAVGETMIVLMATGNTPIMEWNVFNGFRTLSANIAVELPDAEEFSAHYRTLFLAALVLFAMTFVLNTFAEIVRQRSRKRFQQL